MSEQIFEQHVDDHGNVSIRVSDEFVALTRDEAERLRERLDQLEAENAELRRENQSIGMAAYELGRKSMVDENAELREPIIRCRDCENAVEHYESLDVWWCEYLRMYVGPSDFCCRGKRREDE